MIQSGLLNKKITIGNIIEKKDDYGFKIKTFEKKFNPWAKVTPIEEDVTINGNNEQVAKERVSFQIYYREGINKNMFILFNGVYYNVTGIFNPRFSNETLILTGTRDDSILDKKV